MLKRFCAACVAAVAMGALLASCSSDRGNILSPTAREPGSRLSVDSGPLGSKALPGTPTSVAPGDQTSPVQAQHSSGYIVASAIGDTTKASPSR